MVVDLMQVGHAYFMIVISVQTDGREIKVLQVIVKAHPEGLRLDLVNQVKGLFDLRQILVYGVFGPLAFPGFCTHCLVGAPHLHELHHFLLFLRLFRLFL